jgi:hypothetical protein
VDLPFLGFQKVEEEEEKDKLLEKCDPGSKRTVGTALNTE